MVVTVMITRLTEALGQGGKQIVTSSMWSILEDARFNRHLRCEALDPLAAKWLAARSSRKGFWYQLRVS